MNNLPDNENLVLRVVIADDHALVRGGMALLVQTVEENVEIYEASDLPNVISILSQDITIDLMLLDLSMPGIGGLAGIKDIVDTWPDVPIIIVSVTEDIDVIEDALSIGVMGYIPKSSTPDITNSAIKLVLSGGIYIPPHVLRLSMPTPRSLNDTNPSKLRIPASIKLTTRQMEVLELVSQGMSNRAIGDDLGLSENTIKMHISKLFKILKVENRTEAVAKYSGNLL